MTCIPLKPDGSLNIERINELPSEEHTEVICSLNSKQYDEYVATFPPNDGTQHTEAMIVDYTMEEEIARGTGVDAAEYLNNMREKYLA